MTDEKRAELNEIFLKPPLISGDNSCFRIAIESANDGIIIQDMSGKIIWANPGYCKLMGRSLNEMVGRNPLSFALPAADRPTDAQIESFLYDPTKQDEQSLFLYENVRGDQCHFWNQINLSFHQFDNKSWVAILVCRDVSAQVLKDQQLRETTAQLACVAATDDLTGLANRGTLLQFLKDQLDIANGMQTHVGILHIDLDRFKEINDTFGHFTGDAVLRHVANQLKSAAAHDNLVARVGGDEFVIVCPDIRSLEEIAIIGEHLAHACMKPLDWDGRALSCQVSTGVALSSGPTTTSHDMLRKSDYALYAAKRRGRGAVAIYDSHLHAQHAAVGDMTTQLENALNNGEITYYFQPTMSLVTGAIRGFETLVRWKHPTKGYVPPDQFLPLARHNGLMHDIDFGALMATLDLKQALNKTAFSDVRVGLNGSVELLGHPNFYKVLYTEMDNRSLTPADIVIEVLETVVLNDQQSSKSMIAMINQLHHDGFTTLLDDFGTGYAGLTHLTSLKIAGIKIDRSLTRNILTDRTSAKIIAMMIDLCNDLGLYVVTEGIETAQEAAALLQIGGTTIQGYWLAKAMPRAEVLDWLQNRPDIVQTIDRSAIAPRGLPRYLGAE